MHANHQSSYQWHIQGLRAIAVLGVVLFHINPSWLHGGYIGVDIFFVISGYLIMGFIWHDLKQENFSLITFYTKRIYRLFPTMLVMVLVSSIAAYFILLPSEKQSFIESLSATLLYYSNFYFYFETDYFNDAMKFAPLLHTWSLSVEEQFYILFPLLLLIVYRLRRSKSLTVLLSIAFISLLFSQVLVFVNPSLSFYASPSRFFQFIIGGIIAIFFVRNSLSVKVNTLLGTLGLIIILLCYVLFTKHTPFPGIYALIPTLGVALILYVGKQAPFIYTLLSNHILRVVGNTSYSIYLWHWPLIVFYKLKVSLNLSLKEEIMLLLASLVLGYLSWRYIEQTTRHKMQTPSVKPILMTLLGSVTIIATIFTLFYHIPYSGNFRNNAYKYLDYNTSYFRTGSCFLTSKYDNISFFNKNKCLVHQEGKKNLLLIGDSHAAQYYSAMKALLNSKETLSQVTSSGCKPLIPYTGATRCTNLVKWAYEELIPHTHFDTIILSGLWWDIQKSRFDTTIAYLAKYTDRIVILGPSMQYSQSLPRLLMRLNKNDDPRQLYIKAGKYKALSKMDKAIDGFLIHSKHNVTYISLLNTNCDSTGCDTITDNGIPLMFDEGHFTNEGAYHILFKIKDKLFNR